MWSCKRLIATQVAGSQSIARTSRGIYHSARVDARKPRSRAIRLREADLQREITHLEQELHFVEKQEQVSKLTRDLPPVDDALLEAMYHDLLESPRSSVPKRLPGESMSALDRLKFRLGAIERLASPESQNSLEQQENLTEDASTMLLKSSQSTQDFHRAELLQRLESYVNQRQTNHDTNPTNESDDQRALNQDESGVYKVERDVSAEMLPDIPRNEWLAIALDCAQNQDFARTIQALDLMEQTGLAADSAMYTRLVNAFANHGHIDECLALSARMEQAEILAEAPMKHAMVKAYVYSNQLGSALEYLQHWESSEPAPISAYTIATEHLLKHPVRAVHSIAWSLFYHMRFAAHPVPDVAMFALMIRACAAGVPQPNTRAARKPEADAERALDLFREMTLRHQMRPTKEVYDTLILTCARRKEFYAEAVRLVQELLDQSAANSDANASHSLWADTYTFNALLQGSARNGDLKTARWVLAEMLRASHSSSSPRPLVNEEVLSNVFWTYAVYIPPMTDRDLQSVQTSYGHPEDAQSGEDQVGKSKQEPVAMQPGPIDGLEADSHALAMKQQKHDHDSDSSSKHQEVSVAAVAFTQNVPQTSQEVLGEVRALMARMLVDQSASSASLQHPFRGVPITVRILNAFLAVLMHHLPLDQQLPAVLHAIDEPTGVFHESGLEPNIHTLCLVMEAAAKCKVRQEADRVVERIWSQYLSLHSSQQDPQDHINDPSTTSKIWKLYIRNLAKSYEIDRALHALRDFYQQYPPKTPNEKSNADPKSVAPSRLEALDWMPIPPKTSSLKLLSHLDGHVSPNSYQYPKLNIGRPMLRFRDLELLHHRCVALQRKDGIRLITHVDRAYTHYP